MGVIAVTAEAHKAYHKECPAIPTLPPHIAGRVNKIWTPATDPLDRMNGFIEAVYHAAEPKQVLYVELKRATLAIEAMAEQVTFWAREGYE